MINENLTIPFFKLIKPMKFKFLKFIIFVEITKLRFIYYWNKMSFEAENALKNQADEYLRKHRIIELMEDLCSDLSYE